MTIRKDVFKRKIKMVVIDYIQNIIGNSKEYDLITKVVTELQSLARELGITIIMVSQISNEAEKGQSAGAGFKGSGAIEAVSDLAIRLKRYKDKENLNDSCVPVDIIIAKNRHGFTGLISDYVMYLKINHFSNT